MIVRNIIGKQPSPKNSSDSGKSRRSKRQSSRDIILFSAAKMATTKGLNGLSLGDLVAEVGMSKSGLYTHFKSGLARDRVVEVINNWLALLRQCILDGQALGEIDPRAEVAQVVFEIESMLLAANFLFSMMNNPIHLIQARTRIENTLVRLAVSLESKKRLTGRTP